MGLVLYIKDPLKLHLAISKELIFEFVMSKYFLDGVHGDLKEEMKVELMEEMPVEIQDMLVEDGMKSRVTRQTKTKQGNASGCTS